MTVALCKGCGEPFSVPKFNLEKVWFSYCRNCIKRKKHRFNELTPEDKKEQVNIKKGRGLSL